MNTTSAHQIQVDRVQAFFDGIAQRFNALIGFCKSRADIEEAYARSLRTLATDTAKTFINTPKWPKQLRKDATVLRQVD